MCLGMTGVVTGMSYDDGTAMALIDTGAGPPVTASLLTCPQAVVGDTVAVHSGYVLRIIDHQEAAS